MDHMKVVTRAWDLTWRYKILWLFGFFAGGAISVNNSGSPSSQRSGTGTSGIPGLDGGTAGFERWAQQYLAVLVVVALFLLLVGIVMFALSIAARGALVHLGNEAADGRPVKAGDGWRQGFHFWWRTFGIGFLLGLPILVVSLAVGAIIAVVVVAAVASGGGSDAGGAVAGAVFGMCWLFVIAIVLLVPYSIVVSMVDPLALRYAVLDDTRAVAAIKAAWHDVRGRFKDVILMLLMLFAIGVVYGVVVGVIGLVLLVPAAGFLLMGAWLPAVALFILAILVLALPQAVYNTFVYNSWTLFYRGMTGREALAIVRPAYQAAGGYMPPPPPPGYAPPPPVAPPAEAPPAPPAPPSSDG